jgi:hypothetical protein
MDKAWRKPGFTHPAHGRPLKNRYLATGTGGCQNTPPKGGFRQGEMNS